MKYSNEKQSTNVVSTIVRKGGWDAFLVASFALLGFIAATQWQEINRVSSSQPQDILVALISSAGAIFTLWNLLNACIAYLSTVRALPHWLHTLCSAFIARWGTAHARRILLHSGARVAMGVSVFSCGLTSTALAVELPVPDLSPPPTSTSSAHDASTSDAAAAPAPQSGRDTASYHELPRPSLSISLETPQTDTTASTLYEDAPLEQQGLGGSLPVPGSSSSRAINPVVQDAQEHMAHAEAQAQAQKQASKPLHGHSSPSPSSVLPTPDLATDPAQPIRTLHSPTPLTTAAATPSTTRPSQQISPPANSVHIVTPGECLWSIAAALMVDTGNDADIARAWNALYSLNRTAIGPNPDHILPGTVLSVPSTF